MKEILKNILDHSSRYVPRPKYSLPKGNSFLVIAPHYDDDILGCGGTIKLLLSEGKKIDFFYLTDGSKGTQKLTDNADLADIRKMESQRALEKLGVSKESRITNFNFIDGTLNENYKQYAKTIIESLHLVKYNAIFVPYVMDIHPDHRGCDRIIRTVLKEMNTENFCSKIYMYEVWTPLIPNFCVDITHVYGDVCDALKCHMSQLEVHRYEKMKRGLSEYRASFVPEKKVEEVEAFYCCDTQEFIDLVLDY